MTKEEYLELGLAYTKKKQWDAALSALQESRERYVAFSDEDLPPHLLSALGLCLSMTGKKEKAAIDLCKLAIESAFFYPEFHYHLGMVHLKSGRKRDAVLSFYKGLKLDSKHAETLAMLRQMGFRKKRSFPFLARENFMNKFLGKWGA